MWTFRSFENTKQLKMIEILNAVTAEKGQEPSCGKLFSQAFKQQTGLN